MKPQNILASSDILGWKLSIYMVTRIMSLDIIFQTSGLIKVREKSKLILYFHCLWQYELTGKSTYQRSFKSCCAQSWEVPQTIWMSPFYATLRLSVNIVRYSTNLKLFNLLCISTAKTYTSHNFTHTKSFLISPRYSNSVKYLTCIMYIIFYYKKGIFLKQN